MKKKTAVPVVTKTKTPEQIMQANLRKTMRGLKQEVADAEELWLEIFSDVLNALATNAYERGEVPVGESALLVADRVTHFAAAVASSAIDRYEGRWGIKL